MNHQTTCQRQMNHQTPCQRQMNHQTQFQRQMIHQTILWTLTCSALAANFDELYFRALRRQSQKLSQKLRFFGTPAAVLGDHALDGRGQRLLAHGDLDGGGKR